MFVAKRRDLRQLYTTTVKSHVHAVIFFQFFSQPHFEISKNFDILQKSCTSIFSVSSEKVTSRLVASFAWRTILDCRFFFAYRFSPTSPNVGVPLFFAQLAITINGGVTTISH